MERIALGWRCLRHPFALRCLILALAAPLAFGEVTVRRDLPAYLPGHASAFVAVLVVETSSTSPQGLVIEETLPAGWYVEVSTWKPAGLASMPLAPVLQDGVYHWLFDPLGTPVAPGVLTLLLHGGAGGSLAEHRFSGLVKWFDESGGEQLRAVAGDQVAGSSDDVVASIHFPVRRGWNLFSLPFAVAPEDQPDLVRSSTGARLLLEPFLGWDGVAGGLAPLPGVPSPGAGFWAFGVRRGRTSAILGESKILSLDIGDAWQLAGVSHATPFADLGTEPSPVVGWQWNARRKSYLPLGAGDVLVPGRGYWLRRKASP